MDNHSIQEIRQMFDNCTYEEFIGLRNMFLQDTRRGVRELIKRKENKFVQINKKIEEYNKRKLYENELLADGIEYIAGIDEVGRGPLAGPVYAAAVILNPKVDIIEIRDSKKLSKSQREEISNNIKENCLDYSIGFSSVEEIDNLNILNATKLAMKRAVEGLRIKPQHILIDALKLEDVTLPQTSIVKGDDLSISIGAASIIAKVERDNLMDSLSESYPLYYFESNKGYGTSEHIDAIRKYGISDIHRKTFVKNFL